MLGVQVLAVVSITAWTVVIAFILLKAIDATIGLRVPLVEELLGSDIVEHVIGHIEYDKESKQVRHIVSGQVMNKDYGLSDTGIPLNPLADVMGHPVYNADKPDLTVRRQSQMRRRSFYGSHPEDVASPEVVRRRIAEQLGQEIVYTLPESEIKHYIAKKTPFPNPFKFFKRFSTQSDSMSTRSNSAPNSTTLPQEGTNNEGYEGSDSVPGVVTIKRKSAPDSTAPTSSESGTHVYKLNHPRFAGVGEESPPNMTYI